MRYAVARRWKPGQRTIRQIDLQFVIMVSLAYEVAAKLLCQSYVL